MARPSQEDAEPGGAGMTSAAGPVVRTAGLRREVRFLLAVAVPRRGAASQAAIAEWLAAKTPMDWSYFLDQALRQQVVSMVGRNLARHLPRDKAVLPHRWIYSAAYEANARRNRSLFAEFGRILRALNQRGT